MQQGAKKMYASESSKELRKRDARKLKRTKHEIRHESTKELGKKVCNKSSKKLG